MYYSFNKPLSNYHTHCAEHTESKRDKKWLNYHPCIHLYVNRSAPMDCCVNTQFPLTAFAVNVVHFGTILMFRNSSEWIYVTSLCFIHRWLTTTIQSANQFPRNKIKPRPSFVLVPEAVYSIKVTIGESCVSPRCQQTFYRSF